MQTYIFTLAFLSTKDEIFLKYASFKSYLGKIM